MTVGGLHVDWWAEAHGKLRPRSCLLSFFILANEVMPLIEIRRHCNVKETDHHLVVSLIAPGHSTGWVRIVRIVSRVVVPSDGLELGTRLERTRLAQPVAQLPVEVVVHPQQC